MTKSSDAVQHTVLKLILVVWAVYVIIKDCLWSTCCQQLGGHCLQQIQHLSASWPVFTDNSSWPCLKSVTHVFTNSHIMKSVTTVSTFLDWLVHDGWQSYHCCGWCMVSSDWFGSAAKTGKQPVLTQFFLNEQNHFIHRRQILPHFVSSFVKYWICMSRNTVWVWHKSVSCYAIESNSVQTQCSR